MKFSSISSIRILFLLYFHLASCKIVLGFDFRELDPYIFSKNDPSAKQLKNMMISDTARCLEESHSRESIIFSKLNDKSQWELYRDTRLKKLKESLGEWPIIPKEFRIYETRRIQGDGFLIKCLVYETRPGFWACANLYIPVVVPDKMPGIIIAHSHHGGKTGSELQDMGMTWARSGVAVLVPDQIGYGERREHDFHGSKDYDQPFRAGRQDYYFRYNLNLQLSSIGDSLMGWMVWDLMRGVDILLKQNNIDPDRIIMIGSVAGGGDPVGVTAALDSRITCAIPFNFGGWQPESSLKNNPDKDFPWFGDGYWESTRGLRLGARDGFAHFVIVGGIAPRKLIYAHEFSWNENIDPAWPRLKKIYQFYNARDSIDVAHGYGGVRGPGGPENSHCNHVGAVHRKMIYPLLHKWFQMKPPIEYSNPIPSNNLICWTEKARSEIKPLKLHNLLSRISNERLKTFLNGDSKTEVIINREKEAWSRLLGDIEPKKNPEVHHLGMIKCQKGKLDKYLFEPEPGIVIPLFLLRPLVEKKRFPVVIMVAQEGKGGFLRERGDVMEAFLNAGIAICLPDLRGMGESQAGDSSGRTSIRTSISQTNLMLGRPVLGMQLRDLRSITRWLKTLPEIDSERFGSWGDSFSLVNPSDFNTRYAVPHDAKNSLTNSEPNGGLLAGLLPLFESIQVTACRGVLEIKGLYLSPYVYYPHESILPGMSSLQDWKTWGRIRTKGTVDGQNRLYVEENESPNNHAKWLIAELEK